MQFQSIPMVTSDDVLGRAIMRDRDVQKETFPNVKLEADVYVRDAYLTTEGIPGALFPRPVLYLRGHVDGVRGVGLPEGVEYGSFGGQDAPSQGTDVYVRYEFTDLEAMRLMMHGIGRTDWPGLDPRITSNVHQLPITADLTVAHKEGVSVPFIICDVDNPAGLVTNRQECGYDYADYVQWSPSAMRELGPEIVQQMDMTIKNLDRTVVPEVQPEVEQGQTTAYDNQMFRSIFEDKSISDDDEKKVAEEPRPDEHSEPAPETEKTAEATVTETPEERMRREADELGNRVIDNLFGKNKQTAPEPTEAPMPSMTEDQDTSELSDGTSLLDALENDEDEAASEPTSEPSNSTSLLDTFEDDEDETSVAPMSEIEAAMAALDDNETSEERREHKGDVARVAMQQTAVKQAEAGSEGMSF